MPKKILSSILALLRDAVRSISICSPASKDEKGYPYTQPGAQASLTLEAAVVFPLYLFFLLSLLSVMEMLQFGEALRYELSHSAKEIAVYAPAQALLPQPGVSQAEQDATSQGGNAAGSNVTGIADTVLAALYTNSVLQDALPSGLRRQLGVSADISLARSRVLQGDIIDLVATYRMEPQANVFLIPEQMMVQRARTHAWTGYDLSAPRTNDGERIVYVAETGTVYHLTRSCTYLCPSIRDIPVGTQGNYRNSSGGAYTVCELCGPPVSGQEFIYITNDGDRYHSSPACSALRRTIYEMPISQVGNRHACSRCGGSL